MQIQATETSAPPAGLPLSIARFAFRRSAERVRTLRFVLSFPSCNAGCCVFFEYCLIHTQQKMCGIFTFLKQVRNKSETNKWYNDKRRGSRIAAGDWKHAPRARGDWKYGTVCADAWKMTYCVDIYGKSWYTIIEIWNKGCKVMIKGYCYTRQPAPRPAFCPNGRCRLKFISFCA